MGQISLALLSLGALAAGLPDCTPDSFTSALSPGASIVSATRVEQNGTYQVTGDIPYPTSPTNLQALCAVQVEVPSSNSSSFQFGLFLPDNWNDRFLAVGNGGLAGGINWLDMGAGVGYGFATVSTNTGHNSSTVDGSWALNSPEKLIDFGYRAMHGSVVAAKQITAAYYGSQIQYSYYSGCSTGGRQGLKDLEMYPEDFDGVVAGCAAWWMTHLQPYTCKIGAINLPQDAPGHIPVSQYSLIEQEVLRQCDGQDGVKDGIISDPRGCNLYLNAMLCHGNSTTNQSCLTAPQIQTLTNIYTDFIDTNQTFIFPRYEPGSEAQWPVTISGDEPSPLGTALFKYFLGNNPNWTYTDLDYTGIAEADAVDPGDMNANNFDLSAFRARGGKLLTYHGTADAIISTGSSVIFYNNVYSNMVSQGLTDVHEWFRFFLVPGMQHCGGTPQSQQAPWYFAGPNQAGMVNTSLHSTPGFEDARHDILLALMKWTEEGKAPHEIVATVWNNDTIADGVWKQRPMCVYPKRALFKGGDVNVAKNWHCGLPYEDYL